MATDTTKSTPIRLPVSSDVVSGGVLAVLGLLHVFVLQTGGVVGFLALLVIWPLVAGALAGWLSTPASNRRVNATLAGLFGALVVTLVVFLTGLLGSWPSFITENVGVSLWPVTFTVLMVLTVTWTVFGHVGGYVSDRLT